MTSCISISSFALLVGISIGIENCAVGLKICEKVTGIKKYKSKTKKKMKKAS